MDAASQLANSVAVDRRKWNARYRESPGGSSAPYPHPMAVRWRARFVGGRMLDAACGLGRGMAGALDAFAPAYGVDVSDVAIFQARRTLAERRDAAGSPARWVVGDVTAFSWPADFLGLVCSFGFTDVPFLRRIRKAICPGGMILYEGFSRRQISVHPRLNPDWTLTQREMMELFDGWETLESGETDAPPYLIRCAVIRPAKG